MKTRGDSILKTLPEERQRELFDRCQQQKYSEVRAWLRADGIKTSERALSEFYSWYALRASFQQAEADTQNLLELFKEQVADLPESKLTELGEKLFNLQAIKRQDPKLFLLMQTARHRARMDQLKLEQKERALQLDERRIKILEAKAAQADQASAIVGQTELTPEQKEQKIREVFGMA